MLYLMMDNLANSHLVKVGYSDGTKNLSKRRKSYYSHNPKAIMRSTCAGSRDMENACHQTLSELGIRISGTEWFEVPEFLFNSLYNEGMAFFRPNHKLIHFLEEF